MVSEKHAFKIHTHSNTHSFLTRKKISHILFCHNLIGYVTKASFNYVTTFTFKGLKYLMHLKYTPSNEKIMAQLLLHVMRGFFRVTPSQLKALYLAS